MLRGPIVQNGYKPQFSGHETFPLRYGWLKKAFDAVAETESNQDNKTVFLGDDAIARFGVGRNMVASMRHWATAAGVIAEPQGSGPIRTTEFGRKIFSADGFDPYMEHPSTLWLLHWHLAAHPEKTTWFWAFNHFSGVFFEREHLANGLMNLASDRGWSRVAAKTVKADVVCFIRTYVGQVASKRTLTDDALESPLTELGLIKPVGKRDGFRFVRGAKSSLGHGVFVYALLDFWSRHTSAATLSVEAIAHEPGSPGRVFLLDENDVADRLAALDGVTDGMLRWSETAGLKQVVREVDCPSDQALSFVDRDYSQFIWREVA
jgi:hypothetical protein